MKGRMTHHEGLKNEVVHHEEGMKPLKRKHGGRTKKHEGKEHKKHGGEVKGEKSAHRIDKRARGGRMTPKEPLSGAGKMTGGVKDSDEDEGERRSGGRLTAKSRNALPASDFALPGRRYPVEDASHARNALSRVSQNGTAAEKAAVRRKVHEKYPGIGQS
jgi:hypothetical protein